MGVSEDDLLGVDSFIADEGKRLEGLEPIWGRTGRRDFQAAWPIVESNGAIRSKLRFRAAIGFRDFPSIMIIYRGGMVTRLDRALPGVCHRNPVDAHDFGLPPLVCGTHLHAWSDNRHIVAQTGDWELPYRAPIEDKLETFNHMFSWFVDHFGFILEPGQRGVDLPRTDLFDQ